MRNSLLKRAGWAALLVAVAGALVWTWLPPASAPDALPLDSDEALPTAATAPTDAGDSHLGAARQVPKIQGADASPAEPALSGEALTQRAKSQLALDPEGALRDIEAADRLDGREHEERRALEIHAWVRLGKVGLARTLTDHFYRSFPHSERARELERLTGYHPRPGAPATAE